MKKVFAIAAVLGMWAAGGALAADLDSATTSAAHGVKQQADEAASKVQHFKANQAYEDGRYGDAAAAKAKEYKNDITAKKAEWDKKRTDGQTLKEKQNEDAVEKKAKRDKAVENAKDSLRNLQDSMTE